MKVEVHVYHEKLDMFNNIVAAINRLDGRVSNMERRIKLIETKSLDFEKSVRV